MAATLAKRCILELCSRLKKEAIPLNANLKLIILLPIEKQLFDEEVSIALIDQLLVFSATHFHQKAVQVPKTKI